MRIVVNAVSFAIPSVGVGLPLLAIFWWGLPVPWGPTFVSLAWVYILALAGLVIVVGSRGKRAGNIQMGKGTVASIHRGSGHEVAISLSVGNGTLKLAASENARDVLLDTVIPI
jgi:hypothetical protein